MKIDKMVTGPVPVSTAFAFLADFTNTEKWDPGTVRTVRVSGDGDVGTTYANTSQFLGRETELTYVVTEYEPEVRIVLRGENKTVVAHDTMSFAPTADGGTSVRYQAEFLMKGWARLIGPLLTPAFAQLGKKGAKQMNEALNRLGSVG